MIEEIFFLLHVVDGIYKTIHNVVRKKVYLHVLKTNRSIIILILVQISICSNMNDIIIILNRFYH